jgi:hypothetical protein
MKSSLIILFAMLFSAGLFAQSDAANPDQPKLVMTQTVHDFGKIPQGKPVFVDFKAKNNTTASLRIDAVNASCGCTTPEWSNEPIEAGASSTIKVGYNAAAPGYFEKTITVIYAGGNNILLTIKGEVWKTPDQPAPANQSVSFLKTVKPIQKK